MSPGEMESQQYGMIPLRGGCCVKASKPELLQEIRHFLLEIAVTTISLCRLIEIRSASTETDTGGRNVVRELIQRRAQRRTSIYPGSRRICDTTATKVFLQNSRLDGKWSCSARQAPRAFNLPMLSISALLNKSFEW